MYVDDIKLSGKEQHIDPMWKLLIKDVDLGEPTSFLDHVYLGCTPRECQTSKDLVDDHRNMFESKISTGATEKLPYSEKLGANISSLSYEIEGLQINVWNDIANWRTNNSTVIQSRNTMH